jgi:hypothetical protein
VKAAGQLDVGYRWVNAGVAPCLPGGHPAITLKDKDGGIAGVFVDEESDVRSLPVGPPGQAQPIERSAKRNWQSTRPLISFRLPPSHILKPGDYQVFISIGTRTGTPRIALPIQGDDGQRRYHLGSVTLIE